MDALLFENADLKYLNELQPTGWDNITPAFNFYLDSAFCKAIKVVAGEKIIGIGAFIIHEGVAWLAHIIVHKDYRNKGTGGFITQYLIDHIPGKCETIYLIATDMGEPLYKKLGFVAEAGYSFFNNGSFNNATEISDNIKSFSEEYLEQILSLDKEAYGENREAHLKDYIYGSFVFVADNKVQGFYLPAFGNGLIVATGPIAGTELMKLRSKSFDTFILPSGNKPAIACLLNHNYSRFRVAKRMRLGKNRAWQPGNIYNRVSGQIG
ncbi:MAG: GNAT family N-acetyltransferase [Bacteroidia bacterium]